MRLWERAAVVLVLAVVAGCRSGPGVGLGIGVGDTYPMNGATGVDPSVDVRIEFTAPMDTGSVKVTFSPAVNGFKPVWDADVLELARVIPDGGAAVPGLAPNTHYSVKVSGGDELGDTINYEFVFDTADVPATDTVAPTITTTSPVDGSSDVSPQSHVVLSFSEPMRPSTVQVQIGRGTLGAQTWNATYDTLDIAPPPGGFVPGSFNWLWVLGADLAGNVLPSSNLSFTVPEPVAPLEVLGMSPAPGSAAAPGWAAVSLSFSRDMEPYSTAAAIALDPSNSCDAARSQWVNARLYRCVPSNSFSPDTQVTVTVGTGAMDVFLNPLPSAYSASYTTAYPSDTTAPRILGTTPVNTTLGGVGDGTPLVIHYSEPMDRGTAESHFLLEINGFNGRFQWSADNVELSYVPLEPMIPGATVQWTDNFAEDLSGNQLFEDWSVVHSFRASGVTTGDLPPDRNQAVTMGSFGTRTDSLAMLTVGDDARDEASDALLRFSLSSLGSQYASPTAIRQATLILPRMSCEGDVSGLGGILQVDGLAPTTTFDASALAATANTTAQEENVCGGPNEILVDVTDHVRADFATFAPNGLGASSSFRLRFAQRTDADHSPDRLLIRNRKSEQPTLRVSFEYQSLY